MQLMETIFCSTYEVLELVEEAHGLAADVARVGRRPARSHVLDDRRGERALEKRSVRGAQA